MPLARQPSSDKPWLHCAKSEKGGAIRSALYTLVSGPALLTFSATQLLLASALWIEIMCRVGCRLQAVCTAVCVCTCVRKCVCVRVCMQQPPMAEEVAAAHSSTQQPVFRKRERERESWIHRERREAYFNPGSNSLSNVIRIFKGRRRRLEMIEWIKGKN